MTIPRLYPFVANLIRVGLVLGFWLGVVVSLSGSIGFAVVTGALVTAMTAGFIAYDVYIARRSNPDKEL